jgi:hypothetical protein
VYFIHLNVSVLNETFITRHVCPNRHRKHELTEALQVHGLFVEAFLQRSKLWHRSSRNPPRNDGLIHSFHICVERFHPKFPPVWEFVQFFAPPDSREWCAD